MLWIPRLILLRYLFFCYFSTSNHLLRGEITYNNSISFRVLKEILTLFMLPVFRLVSTLPLNGSQALTEQTVSTTVLFTMISPLLQQLKSVLPILVRTFDSRIEKLTMTKFVRQSFKWKDSGQDESHIRYPSKTNFAWKSVFSGLLVWI